MFFVQKSEVWYVVWALLGTPQETSFGQHHILALELVVTPAFLRWHHWTWILMSTADRKKCPQYSSAPGALTSTSSVSKTSVELGGIFPQHKDKKQQCHENLSAGWTKAGGQGKQER